jgi:hypothetical protein
MIELLALTFVLLAVFAVSTVAIAALKLVIWTVLLPVRGLFHVVLLPFLLLKVVLGGLVFLVLGPILTVIIVGAALIAAVALIAPLLPVILVGLLLWAAVRAAQPTALVR